MHVIAATSQQSIGLIVAALVVVGWLVYIVVNLRNRTPEAPVGSEVALAPNRKPYLDDEALEGPRLEKVLGWALVLLAVTAIGPLVYWLREPSRQQGAVRGFEQRAVNRGRSLFQPTTSPEPGAHFGCATCHGSEGQGGVAKYSLTTALGQTRSVQWAAPAINTALDRFSPDEVRTILVYGRANSPMPAWGVLGGGPMNDQQIDDLVAYLGSIKLSTKDAIAQSTKDAQAEAKRTGMSPDDGEVLFNVACARCHTKGWSYGEPEVSGGGAYGPNLTNGDTLRQFPNRADHIEFITNGSEFGKPYGTRGVGNGRMPGFGQMLTKEQIAAIVDYERSL